MNQASSRSHCIFTLFVEGRKVGSDRVMHAKLHLVDLAGSERVHKTKSDGQTLREAQFINTSLFFLEMVIVALGEKSQGKGGRTHVPYRNSMMTSVLRDSLGGNCKTIMVATISAEAAHTDESISTCRFAQRVALVKNDALVNEDVDPAQQIVRLKGEVSNLKAEVAYLKGEAGEGAPVAGGARRAPGVRHASAAATRTLAIGGYTLAKIHDCFAILKNLVLDRATRSRAAARRRRARRRRGPRQRGGRRERGLEEELAPAHAARRERDRDPRQHGQAGQGRAARQRGGVERGGGGGGGGGRGSPAPSSATRRRPCRATPTPRAASAGGGGGAGAKPAGGGAAAARAARSIGGVAVALPPSERELLEDPQRALRWFAALRGERDGRGEQARAQGEVRARQGDGRARQRRARQDRVPQKSIEGSAASARWSARASSATTARRRRRPGGRRGGARSEEREHRPRSRRRRRRQVVRRAAQLKKEIEHIQRLLEKGRAKLQADFDQWYDAVLRLEQAAPPARGAWGDAAARRDAPRARRASPGEHGAGDGAGGDAKRAGCSRATRTPTTTSAPSSRQGRAARRRQQQAASRGAAAPAAASHRARRRRRRRAQRPGSPDAAYGPIFRLSPSGARVSKAPI